MQMIFSFKGDNSLLKLLLNYMDSSEDLTWKLIGLKTKSKKEMYRLLTTEANVYLPPIREANYLYIRGILTGEKKVFKFYLHSLFSLSSLQSWSELK